MRNLEVGDWRGAFRFRDEVMPWDMLPSAEENDDIRAPDSMPAEWTNRSMPDLVEWHNPCYSHGPSKNNPADFFSEAVPRTAAAAEEEAADHPAQPAAIYDGTRSGPAWTVVLCALWGCRDTQGFKASLHIAGRVVADLLPSELSIAFVDYERAISEKRANFTHIFTPSVENLVVAVAAKFKQEVTAGLPLHVLQLVFGFISLSDNGVLCTVSQDFREAAEGDGLWREAYDERFPVLQSETSERAGQGGPDAGDERFPVLQSETSERAGQGGPDAGGGGCGPVDCREATATKPTASGGNSSAGDENGDGFKGRYKRRLLDPHVGDEVQVAWKGKFRLESLEVYDGTAWWLARVVDKGENPGYYKVHYPGWEPKWDEWVVRDRLRWGNEHLAAPLKGIPLQAGDAVEVWCKGLHVPGAWLEAVVYEVEKERVYLGEVLTSGHFWARTEHVRLIRRGPVDDDGGEFRLGYTSACRRRSNSVLLQCLTDAGFTTESICCNCSVQ